MNGLFIACLGLSFREVSDAQLALFYDIINNFGLNIEHIKELNKGTVKNYAQNCLLAPAE